MIALALLTLIATPDQTVAHRFAVVVGKSTGGADRLTLHYATSDAKSFADAMLHLGGIERDDADVLLEPSAVDMRVAFLNVTNKVRSASSKGERTELVFYYSGHSDDSGLLVGDSKLDYGELRRLVDSVPADVRIAILDSCASGAFTRAKGGVRKPAFLVDASSRVHGHAFLSSSAADESAQESDAIGASYFTHALVSGILGAADVNGDGRVSLTEAYQFAFHETVARSERSALGSQHPAFAIDLQGTGDFVMTDLRKASSTLSLPIDLDGRVFVRDRDGNLVVELNKTAGREISLGLEPGDYRVVVDRGNDRFATSITLVDAATLTLDATKLERVPGEPVTARGPSEAEQKQRAAERKKLAERAYVRDAVRVEDTPLLPLFPRPPFISYVGEDPVPLEMSDFFDRVERPDLRAQFESNRDAKDMATWIGGGGTLAGMGLCAIAVTAMFTLTAVPDLVFGGIFAGMFGSLMFALGSDTVALVAMFVNPVPVDEDEAKRAAAAHNAALKKRLGLAP